MKANVFTKDEVNALRMLRQVWAGEKIVLIGATALGCFFDMRWHQTYDLDLSISVSLEYSSDLNRLVGWSRDSRIEQRWLAPGNVRIDIIPAASNLLDKGEVVWPQSGFRMSLVGLRLAFEHGVALRPAADFEILVAPVPVIAVLKVISYQEKAQERTRDLADIAYILEEFLSPDDQRRFSDQAFEFGLNYEETSAFFLGKEIGSIANKTELAKFRPPDKAWLSFH